MKCMKKSHYKNLSNYEILKMNFINKKKIFDGKNIQVFNYKFEKNEKEIQHEIIEQGGISCVLAIDQDEVIMVKQFRYPFDQVLEIPAGNIEKSETRSDWSKRPLHPKQLNYAIEDVAYLMELGKSLKKKLKLKGRLEWSEEDCKRMLATKTGLMDQENAWKKIKGIKIRRKNYMG